MPAGGADQEQRRGPRDVEQATLRVRAGRSRVEVNRVADREQRQRQPDQEPAPTGAPARERERGHDERQKDDVAERVGDVRGHDAERAVRRVEHGLDEDRAAERGGGERSAQPVDPETSRCVAQPGAKQEHEPDVAGREEREVESVGERRIRRLDIVVVEPEPRELGRRVEADGERHHRPTRHGCA